MEKNMLKHLLLISSLLVSSITSAEYEDKWLKISSSDDTIFFLNPTRILVTDNSMQIVDAWTKGVFKKTSKLGNDIYLKGDYYLTKDQYGCVSRTSRMVSSVAYAKGKNPKTYTLRGEWEEVIPESISESLFNEVCSFKFPKESS